MSHKKSKDEMLNALTGNIKTVLPQAVIPVEEEIIPAPPSNLHITRDSEEDFEFARAQIKTLIGTSKEAIDDLANLARDAEHPRAYEVLSTLIKNTSDMAGQLLNLSKERKKIINDNAPLPAGGVINSTTNNSIFVGTTTELQKFLKQKDEQPIDV
jgi:hypothetical protein